MSYVEIEAQVFETEECFEFGPVERLRECFCKFGKGKPFLVWRAWFFRNGKIRLEEE